MSDSIWKKELSFKKKPKAEAPAADVPATIEPAQPKQSFLKKEISFKKKEKAPQAAEAPAEPKQSFLKKEISFKKKEKAPQAAEAPAQQPSLLKKEISFGRRKQQKTIEQLAAEAAAAFGTSFDAVAPEPPAEVLPTALAEAAVAAMPDPNPPEPEPQPEAAPEPYAGLSPAIVAATADEVEPMPVAQEWPAAETVAPEPEPWLAEPELPPAPEAPAPVVLHPPVPASELPPVVEPKVPFWKKDVSLSKKAKAPKAPKEPKAAGQPFWKKELSLGRKKPAAEAVAEAPTQTMPAAPKGSFLKRDLSLSVPKLSLPSRGGGAKGSRGEKRYVGLKIGASQLAAARVSNNGHVELLQIAREPLAQGIVVAGEVRDPEALAEALKAFFARHKLPRKNVRIGIASNRIGVRIFDMVGIADDKQLANAIQFRAQEALPIPLDEAVLDYRVLDSFVNEEGTPVKRVLLVVAYRDLVERYISACKKAGIGLAGIDLEAFALLRSLVPPADRGNAATVVLAIGHDRSTFAVTDGRVCEFTRVLEWGGWSLNVALARALDTAPSEVEGFKRAMSLDTNMQIEGLTIEQSGAALDAVRKQLQAFARELVSSLSFYQNQPGSLAIGSVVISGGTAHLPGLAVELERLIGARVVIGDPFARLKVSKKLDAPDPVGSLSVAVGLGIED
jgi:type IV pilus assembly protein PilM